MKTHPPTKNTLDFPRTRAECGSKSNVFLLVGVFCFHAILSHRYFGYHGLFNFYKISWPILDTQSNDVLAWVGPWNALLGELKFSFFEAPSRGPTQARLIESLVNVSVFIRMFALTTTNIQKHSHLHNKLSINKPVMMCMV